MRSRALATEIVSQVINEQITLTLVLEAGIPNSMDTRDKAFVRDLCFGVMRWSPQLDHILESLLVKPIKRKNLKLRVLCWLGLYQLLYQRTADHGAVSATVDACGELSIPWAKGLVNAVLRGFIRNRDKILEQVEKTDSAKYAHPDWLIESIRQDWPEQWQDILLANNEQADMSLRVNVLKTSPDLYRKKLTDKHIEFEITPYNSQGITLNHACDTSELPDFDKGFISVQDGAAQLAAKLIDLKAGFNVLDACAAPGGKTCHMLEQEPGLEQMTAIDNQAERLEKINDNLHRLGLHAETILADACDTASWWDGRLFDRILLDAPCSATGVIRRHPDIKTLRSLEAIERINAEQSQLLDSLWLLLAPGGKLVYASCSVLKRENDGVIESFLNKASDVKILKQNVEWGIATAYGTQILPGQNGFDGFYYATLEKTLNAG